MNHNLSFPERLPLSHGPFIPVLQQVSPTLLHDNRKDT